ncbi:ABC transporter permease [Dysosmobacter sp. NSJ-60]|uniref:Peptide ABC transporter permease n=1 Tax=Pusillibacter faecalis TaxID=2714358 RepID=A0A830QU98_9FIRM|nr:ABC transporter permease [Pusillibacter faecalis]MBC5748142.1 ABC transporter permease [Dysosmobacter hominis]MBS5658103.1 ABC transporter permease [Oscillibacter sp.]MCQ5026326.1 ABC transporter permease [Oscillibacter valericigenes]BCK86049.1 peptide ABC transporter permease [Pusillibacter faecalis]
MLRYILKRILLMIPVLLGIVVIVFTLMYVGGGDPTISILGENVTPEAQAEIREELGLDDPYLVRLGNYLLDLLHGDLGDSYRSKRPVMDEILARYPTTLKLTFGSIALGIVVGVIVGIISAVRQYSLLDKIGTFISLFGVSAPSFWIAMMLVLVFSVKLNLLPATGSHTLACWVLPVVTLGLQCGAFIMRMTRSSMLEVIRQDYIRTAKAKGQSEFKIVISHAFRNALVPIITTIGIQICGFLAGSVLVESVFALPGLGKYVVDSVNYKDYPAVQGVVLFIAINCVIINLLTDIIYCFVDPRIKAQYGRKKGVKFSQKEAAQHG